MYTHPDLGPLHPIALPGSLPSTGFHQQHTVAHLPWSISLCTVPWAQPGYVLSEHMHKICLYLSKPTHSNEVGRLLLTWVISQRGLLL